ncbi:MAG: ABC transporter ATP-binding protein [Candidatus Hydrogenedentota bacterium]
MNGPALETERVSLRFGDFHALRDISFAAPIGAFVAIIGPNGAGKSTLLNVILGIQKPDQGIVRIFGSPVHDANPMDVGFIPQVKTLDRRFPGKAIELVVTGITRRWPWRVSTQQRQLALEAMEKAGVAPLADRSIPHLSGGELQRVYLARCLVRKPKLLILDEPGAGMDVAGEAEMYHLLERYQRTTESTVLMITHDWEGARVHATHVLLMHQGIAGFGPPEEVAREERLLAVFGFTGHRAASGGSRDV